MLSSEWKDQWVQAAQDHLQALRAAETFSPISFNSDSIKTRSRILPTRWVFTYKGNEHGYLLKRSARLVIYGDLEVKDSAISTYAATPPIHIFRFLFALCAGLGWEYKQFDVKSAFLNAHLQEEYLVYVYIPDG